MNCKKYVMYLFDGTGQDYRNDDEKRDWSNIVRLHAFLHQSPPSDGELIDMYGDGVGCRGNENILNEITGQGLEERIEEAYYDIGGLVKRCHDDGDDLHVSVFGFSRGAYAARVFCALIDYCGVPNTGSFYDAVRWARKRDIDAVNKAIANNSFLGHPTIDFLGLFDTVAMTDVCKGIDIKRLPRNVKHARHALSYNERRAIFPLSRFDPGQPNVEEVWFLGSHTDIGGGYRKRGLADYSLRWMIEKANEHGLTIKETPIIGDNAMHVAEFNDSSSFCCGVASFFKKGRIHNDRKYCEGDLFHWSAYDERMQFLSLKPRLPPETMMAYTSRHHESRVAVV
ncbi:MAG: phospholipase effector Tle1 domain-containing protein [Prevotella sp.]